jgi:hypothetical protein
MASPTDFAKMVPGFDFLQGLMKNAGAGLPSMGQWIAPTLDPAELDKRIDELKTVQFWLEQNAKLMAGTIQALEVQRMTLSTLQTMNLPLAELRESLKMPLPAAPAPAPAPAASAAAAERPPSARRKARTTASAASNGSKPTPIDPMQWWGALTQQFTEIAAKAMKESAGDTARNLASAMVKQSIDGTGKAVGKVMGKAVGKAVETAAAPLKAAAKVAGASAAPARRRSR